jgi:MFS family permease
MLPTFMEVLDTAIASVALPHIAGSLSATTDAATWVLTSYLVANAIILPASGWFSLRFWPPQLSAFLHRGFHDFVVHLRRGHQPGNDSGVTRDSRRRRRRAATVVASDSS